MMMYGYGFNNGAWGNGGFWWVGLLMMAAEILFWGLIIWFGVSLFKRNSSGRSQSADARNEALDILRERYARGEIDAEEFRQRKEDLVK